MGTVHKITCPDCGPVPINHALSKYVLVVDWVMTPMNKLSSALLRSGSRLANSLSVDNLGVPLFIGLSKIGLTQIRHEPDSKNSDRAKCLWIAANTRGIKMYEIRLLGRMVELFGVEYQGKRLLFEALPRPIGPKSDGFYWMDNKAKMREKFAAAGIPIAIGGVAFSFAEADKIRRKVQENRPNWAVITKPHIGSRSRHTNIHLVSEADLRRGFKIAKRLSPFVIVEQELTGMVHRATVLGGKLIAVLRREPPFVTGDGISNLRQLIEKENQNPKRHGPTFHEIPIDEQTEAEILRQGLTWDFVPDQRKEIIVRNNIGRSSGGTNSDKTALVHPDNRALFEKVAEVLGDPVVGIDFIIEDISKSWKEQMPCGVIECNSVPFLDLHHYPLNGEVIDAAGAMWDVVFPEAKPVL